MKMKVEDIAKICHDANASLRKVLGEEPSKCWDDLTEEQQNGVAAGVKYFFGLWQRGVRQGPVVAELMHSNWICSMVEQGVTDHPNMVPYSDLTDEQRVKDFLFAGICATFIGAMSGQEGAK